MNEEYRDYLMSEEWQRKRSARLKMDNYQCQVCDRPFDLQVHHTTYANIFHECVETDLITLCNRCHEAIEEKKRNYNSMTTMSDLCTKLSIKINKAAYEWHKRNVKQFIAEIGSRDYSSGGDLDLCKLVVIKAELYPWLKAHGDLQENGANMVQAHFRNERYKIILDYKSKGYPPEEVVKRTRFSSSMIYKVYQNPETAIYLIKEEES